MTNIEDITVDKASLIEKVKTIVALQIKIDKSKLVNKKSMNHYGVSSLSSIFIVNAINEAFHLNIELEDLLENFTIEKLVNLILKEKNAINF